MLLVLIVLATLIISVGIFYKLSNWKALDRFLAAFFPIAAITLLGCIINQLMPTAFWDWHASRLASTFAVVYGYGLYFGSDSGSVISTHKGPTAYLPYLPATHAHSPTTAIVLAQSIAAMFFFLPILWLYIGRYLQTPERLLLAFSAFLCFGFLALQSQSMGLSATAIAALSYIYCC